MILFVEIASIIYKFIILLKEGNLVQYEQELNSLPKPKQWLSSMHQVQPETVVSNMVSYNRNNNFVKKLLFNEYL